MQVQAGLTGSNSELDRDEVRFNQSGIGNSPLPSGEVGAQRRVRGYGLSVGDGASSPDLLRKSTSPRWGEVNRLAMGALPIGTIRTPRLLPRLAKIDRA